MDGESRKKRYNTRSKKREKDKEMKKKNHSNDNGNGSGNNNDDDEEINALEYKKFLKKLFPSSHMDKSVEDLEKKNAKDEEDDDDDEEFIPYDECSLSELKGELKLRGIKYNIIKDCINEENIHSYLDGGFVKDTQIEVEDGNSVNIQDIEVDDVLYNGEIVTGIVEIDATNLQIYEYIIENKKLFGGPNLQIINNNIHIIENTNLVKKLTKRKEKKLYHIITNKYSFNMGGIHFLDYNGGIETLLDEDRLNLIDNIIQIS